MSEINTYRVIRVQKSKFTLLSKEKKNFFFNIEVYGEKHILRESRGQRSSKGVKWIVVEFSSTRQVK
jgi:hypothetical protein